VAPSYKSARKPSLKPCRIHPDQSESNRIPNALIILCLVTLSGTIGFVYIEDEWTVWRAFYFTLVTITTVGYSDEGISETGEKFATFLLIGGVASASYAFATIVQTSVANQLAWRSKMQKRVLRLRDHTIVCGYGRMGKSVCEKLAREHRAFVVLERDPQQYEEAARRGYLAVQGTASEDAVLISAGIEHAAHVVAAVDSIAENIVIAMSSRDLNPAITIIARAEREEDVKKLERAGVSRVLCPFQSGGRETVDFIVRPHVAEFLAQASMGGSDVALADVRVADGSELIGTSLGHYGRDRADRVSFVALCRADGTTLLPPRGTHEFEAGDHLIVAGDPDQIDAMGTIAQRPASAPRLAS
jgi:voltage-gated potassium channel